MNYRALKPENITATLKRLSARICERFPESGLAHVCMELTDISAETKDRIERLVQPNMPLRIASAGVAVGGVACLAYVVTLIEYKREIENIFGVLEGFDALLNIVVLMGAGMFFLATLESRWRRQRALDDLHQLRSIVHVIDMHQLAKDPRVLTTEQRTPSSPLRTMSQFELTRYLDYCTEMLSLTAKIAALYAQSAKDSAVLAAVSELETVTANLSYKIWQKIMIIQSAENAQEIMADIKARNEELRAESSGSQRPPRIVEERVEPRAVEADA
ncbi:MAG: hypothetical protein AAFR23_01940 [Pseudomonadota bacterium]